jgi:hypothetical protein
MPHGKYVQGTCNFLTAAAATALQCIDNCEPGKCCFAQLQYLSTGTTGTCKVMALNAATNITSGWQLMYKLVPSDAIAAFTKRNSSSSNDEVTAKMLSSTTYQVRK